LPGKIDKNQVFSAAQNGPSQGLIYRCENSIVRKAQNHKRHFRLRRPGVMFAENPGKIGQMKESGG
jgi:hypothetical protein